MTQDIEEKDEMGGSGYAAAVALLMLAGGLAGCGAAGATSNSGGSSTAGAQTEASQVAVAPTSTPTVNPSASSSKTAVGHGAMGDTNANPDDQYVCAAQAFADDGVTVINFVTVAGANSTETSAMCAFLKSDKSGVFQMASSLHGFPPAASCYWTFRDGGGTVRVYTAPDGTDDVTTSICNALFTGFNGS